MNKRKIRVFDLFNMIFFGLFALLCLYPFLNQLLISLASPADYLNAKLLPIPYHFNLESYKFVLFQNHIGSAFLISIGLTVVGTGVNMLMTILGAYVLGKEGLPGRKIFFYLILFTMFFGGGLIPFYITVRNLGLAGSLASLVLPFSINTFNMIILRNAFTAIPKEIYEACEVDGATDFTILFVFVVPMSITGIATVALFYLVERWNDWYWPMLFIHDSELFPLALELRNILSYNQSTSGGSGQLNPALMFSEGQKAATIIVSIIPILCVYPFIQKYFVKGLMLGSVKG